MLLGASGIVKPRQINAFASAPPNNPKYAMPNATMVENTIDTKTRARIDGYRKILMIVIARPIGPYANHTLSGTSRVLRSNIELTLRKNRVANIDE